MTTEISLYPSLISGDILALRSEIEKLEPWCAGFHMDIMDFHFVPNLTWGPLFINALRKTITKQMWVHLMVDDPSRYLPLIKLYHNDIVTIHYESGDRDSLDKLLEAIVARGWLPGITVKPGTELSVLIPFLPRVHQVLLMSVEPGFSGQAFLPDSYQRLQELVVLRDRYNPACVIAVDGGVSEHTITHLTALGARQYGIASAIFGACDPVKMLERLHELALLAC